MKKIIPFRKSAPEDGGGIGSEACDWFARLDRGDLTPQEKTAFTEWLAEHPDHRLQFQRLQGLWTDLDVLDGLTDSKKPLAISRRGPIRFTFPGLAGALALVLLITLAIAIAPYLSDMAPQESAQVYITGIGEQRLIPLPDGSTVLLNTASRIKTGYGARQRIIHLTEGEAHFTVTRDPGRPFHVHTRLGVVRAIGTAFTVRLRPQDVEVTITEGTIELASLPNNSAGEADNPVAPEALSRARLAIVNAGYQATFNRQIESIQPISAEELSRKLSWQNGMLSFSGDPLSVMVEEISRYTPVKIVIQDPALRELRVGGYFRIGETRAMFEALEKTFNVQVQRVGEELVYLSAAAP